MMSNMKYPNYNSISVVNEVNQEVSHRSDSRRRSPLLVFGCLLVALATLLTFVTGNGWNYLSRTRLLGSSKKHHEHDEHHHDHHDEHHHDKHHEKKQNVIKELETLDKKMQGSVFLQHDVGFCDAAHAWKEGLQPPLAVVQVATEADVQLAVVVLAKLDVEFRIKSGGHSYGGYSTAEDGVVLDLGKLNSLLFDESTGAVTMGPAAKVQDLLDDILVPFGYGGVCGECPGVAEGGFVLGGGFGFYSRKYGLGLDNLLGARVVLPDGAVAVASATENPDLFWALRGAGQNMFGVVTQLEYQLYPSQDTQLFVSGKFPLDASALFQIGTTYRSAPGELALIIVGPVYEDGTSDALFTWFDQDADSLDVGEAYIRDNVLSFIPEPELSFVRLPWSEVTRQGDSFPGNLVRAWAGFMFEESNTVDVWNDLIDKIKSVCIGNPYLVVEIELWGGKIAEKVPTDTAFFFRNAVYNIGFVLLVPADEEDAEKIFEQSVKKVDHVWQHMSQHLEGVYANYVMESLSKNEYAKAYWGDNVERLQQLKEKYDPENVFHHPQSVKPLGEKSQSS